jgi:aminoglycoside phosphotransferase family enzyme
MAAEVRFLSLASSYPDRPEHVEVIETHFAWVFLTGRFAYKLRKPLRLGSADLTDPAVRRRSCEQEVSLNRRLAEATYLGVELLTAGEDGALALGGAGTAVDWLVKMVQLPAARMMDRLIRQHAVTDGDLDLLVAKLVRFDRLAPVSDDPRFGEAIGRQLLQARAELLSACDGIPAALASHAADLALRYADQRADRLRERVAAGRVRELHGDLRPEHVCLLPDPQIIDCLEFDRALRLLDCAQEVCFLAMECRAVGDDSLAQPLLDRYQRSSGDHVPADLMLFYLGERAVVRAMLACRHLTDPAVPSPGRWLAVTEKYLAMAGDYLGRLPPSG